MEEEEGKTKEGERGDGGASRGREWGGGGGKDGSEEKEKRRMKGGDGQEG